MKNNILKTISKLFGLKCRQSDKENKTKHKGDPLNGKKITAMAFVGDDQKIDDVINGVLNYKGFNDDPPDGKLTILGYDSKGSAIWGYKYKIMNS